MTFRIIFPGFSFLFNQFGYFDSLSYFFQICLMICSLLMCVLKTHLIFS
uniref:Uncharacterized protein n=1 Tax=Rhizophora mucronata TaxID=61149 RepID=A0A2P2PET4_RHIMU